MVSIAPMRNKSNISPREYKVRISVQEKKEYLVRVEARSAEEAEEKAKKDFKGDPYFKTKVIEVIGMDL